VLSYANEVTGHIGRQREIEISDRRVGKRLGQAAGLLGGARQIALVEQQADEIGVGFDQTWTQLQGLAVGRCGLCLTVGLLCEQIGMKMPDLAVGRLTRQQLCSHSAGIVRRTGSRSQPGLQNQRVRMLRTLGQHAIQYGESGLAVTCFEVRPRDERAQCGLSRGFGEFSVLETGEQLGCLALCQQRGSQHRHDSRVGLAEGLCARQFVDCVIQVACGEQGTAEHQAPRPRLGPVLQQISNVDDSAVDIVPVQSPFCRRQRPLFVNPAACGKQHENQRCRAPLRATGQPLGARCSVTEPVACSPGRRRRRHGWLWQNREHQRILHASPLEVTRQSWRTKKKGPRMRAFVRGARSASGAPTTGQAQTRQSQSNQGERPRLGSLVATAIAGADVAHFAI